MEPKDIAEVLRKDRDGTAYEELQKEFDRITELEKEIVKLKKYLDMKFIEGNKLSKLIEFGKTLSILGVYEASFIVGTHWRTHMDMQHLIRVKHGETLEKLFKLARELNYKDADKYSMELHKLEVVLKEIQVNIEQNEKSTWELEVEKQRLKDQEKMFDMKVGKFKKKHPIIYKLFIGK